MADWFTIELPRPPSVNRFMAKLGNKSPNVAKWIKTADGYLMGKRYPRIKCPYELVVEFPIAEFGKYDQENHLKALSDWLQRVEMIQNDKLAAQTVLRLGEVPNGFCRVSVRPWEKI